MAKLNPPILEGKIPAFVLSDGINIPFVMNRSVAYSDVNSMAVKFKTVGGIELGVIVVDTFNDPTANNYIDTVNNEIVITDFTQDNIGSKLNIQQYYKIQLAYIDEHNNTGYYSSVGVVKFTAKPTIECEKINSYEFLFRGYYTPNNADKTEKFYSYHFELQRGHIENSNFIPEGDPIEVTEEKLHLDADLNYEDYEIRKNLDFSDNHKYRVTFFATSVNDYQGTDEIIINEPSLDPFPVPDPEDPTSHFALSVTNEYDNGYSIVTLNGGTLPATYTYVLWRYNEQEEWVKLNSIFISPFNDFTIEQGKQYIYAIQGIPVDGESNATEKLQSSLFTAQFEDMFLGDKDRQLKIEFNPKVNAYKRTILESKVDTIGGKYPIVFRNGNVDYREIGLGGLISYLMDEDNLFKVFAAGSGEPARQDTNSTTNDQPHMSTSLSDQNRHKERLFREAVLEWLTNGEPKYFRSPTEGNHIVRVMNVSLSPIDTVGRMIYNFTATSYEVADNTIDNLIKYRLASWEV